MCSSQHPKSALSSARRECGCVGLVAYATGRTLVELFAMTVAQSDVRMLEVTMNSPAIARVPGCSRLVLIVAGVLALLGSFAVTAPAQAGYYGEGYYPRPCADRCGYYAPRRYYAPRNYGGCSSCGCARRCYSGGTRSRYYERRYVEREYIERGYGAPVRRYGRHYGYNPYGGYRSYSRPYPWGYGGVRGWRSPYGSQYEPAAESYTDGYEEPPRPPAPVWGEADE
jgi:hypothetical protein